MNASESSPAAGERLQNILAARGIASRRGAAEIIRGGRVSVNGQTVTEPGARVPADAALLLDGRPVSAEPEEHHTYIYNKPAGEVSSTDGQGARTVLEVFAGLPYRLVPVGRLDRDSEGLLLISNDGDLIQRLTHPRFAHTKTYEVEVDLQPTPEQMELLRSPMTLEGYTIRPVPVERLDSRRLRFVLSEGRHRQIRLMCAQVGLRVQRLRRVELSGLTLGNLRVGHYRELLPREVEQLLKPRPPSAGSRRPEPAPAPRPAPHAPGDRPAGRRPDSRSGVPRFDGERRAPLFDGRRADRPFDGRADRFAKGRAGERSFDGRDGRFAEGRRSEGRPFEGRRDGQRPGERWEAPRFDGRRKAPRFDGRRSGPRFDGRRSGRA